MNKLIEKATDIALILFGILLGCTMVAVMVKVLLWVVLDMRL